MTLYFVADGKRLVDDDKHRGRVTLYFIAVEEYFTLATLRSELARQHLVGFGDGVFSIADLV
jgi:hypothetical protein